MPLNASDIFPGIPLGRGVSILDTHPEGLVALHKPCRVLSHPNSEADRKRSLIQASWSQDRERYIWKDGEKSHRLYLLHRLDALTSGVILGCVNPKSCPGAKASVFQTQGRQDLLCCRFRSGSRFRRQMARCIEETKIWIRTSCKFGS